MLGEVGRVLLGVAAFAAFTALVSLVAVAGAAAWWSVCAAWRGRHADRHLTALREQHYEEVRRRAHAPLIELEAVEFDDWPVLDAEPPIVFPRRRAA